MFRSNLLATLAALTFSSLAGLTACSSSDANANADTATITKQCKKTRCDEKGEADRIACDRCMSACIGAGYSCDLSRACDVSCGPATKCSDADRQACVDQGFELTLPSTASEDIATECRRVVATANECGWEFTTATGCDARAETDHPDRAEQYACLADLSCNASADDVAACAPPESDFGDRLCSALEAPCPGFCNDDLRAALGRRGAWLKDTVMNAAIECAAQPACTDAAACIGAWIEGIAP